MIINQSDLPAPSSAPVARPALSAQLGSRRGSQYVMFVQVELLLGHDEVPQVPEYPGDQAEEDQQRPGQHEEVPETQRGEDPDEEEQQADDVHNHSQRQAALGAAALLHGPGQVGSAGQVDFV